MRLRSACLLLCSGAFLGGVCPVDVKAGVREEWSKAISKPLAEDARPLMESILSRNDDPGYAARAALWLGQLEYTMGRTATGLIFFRQAGDLSGDSAVRAESAFWAEHCESLLSVIGPDPEEDADSLPGAVMNASDFFRALAMGDAEIRSGRPTEALRRYLSLEGESRQLNLVGPLAYRVALVVAFARSAGETDPLFSWSTLDGWEPALARASERGLITALRRREDALPAPPEDHGSEAATDFAELPGPAPKNQRVANRSFPAPNFSLPDSFTSDYVEDGAERGDGSGRRKSSRRNPRSGLDQTDRVDRYVVQLGAFDDRDTARRQMEVLTTRGLSVRLEPGWAEEGGRIYRILLGQPASREEQERFARRRLKGLDYQLYPVDP